VGWRQVLRARARANRSGARARDARRSAQLRAASLSGRAARPSSTSRRSQVQPAPPALAAPPARRD